MNSRPLPPGLERLLASLAPPFMGFFEPSRYKAFFGGRGSGKSYSAAVALLVFAYFSQIRVCCAREFQASIADSVYALLVELIYKAGIQGDWEIGAKTLRHKDNNSHFIFMGLERNRNNIRSLQGVDIFLVEEAHTTSALSLEVLIPTIREFGSEIWFLWNPDKKDDPVDEMFRGSFPPEDAVIQMVSWRDNPAFHLSPMKADMERDRKRDAVSAAHVWDGAYRGASGALILTNWQTGVIDVPSFARALYGADWGYHPDPTAVTKSYILENNVLYISHEAYGYKVADADMPALFDMVPGTRHASSLITADSSDPRLFNSMLRRGFRMRKAEKGNGSVLAGINWLQGKDIVIHPRCKETIREAKLWQWEVDPKTAKPIIGKPLDGNDHTWDATRYATEQEMKSHLIIRVRGGKKAPVHQRLRLADNSNEPASSAATILKLMKKS